MEVGEAAAPAELGMQDVQLPYAHNKPLSFHIELGKVGLLYGGTGVGKTIALNVLAHFELPLNFSEKRKDVQAPFSISYALQTPPEISHLSAHDVLSLVVPMEWRSEAMGVAESLLGTEHLGIPVRSLSGGQQKLLQLIYCLFAPTQAVLLDEPFGGLDSAKISAATDVIIRYARGRAILLTGHSNRRAKALGATAIHLEKE